MNSFSESYKKAGVDITAGYRSVELIKKRVASTFNAGCLDDIGGFGGLFDPSYMNMKHPVLVSGTDGVGTKLKLAFLLDKHDTVGIDCVAMCVNDVLCCGARPMFFLDYLAVGKNIPEKIDQIVSGVAEGCRSAGAALIGGETAEMPGFYPEDEYDLAGFTVGAVEKEKISDKNSVVAGDVIIALPSSGVHSNGYSLIRKVFDIDNDPSVLHRSYSELDCELGEELLKPTKIYVEDFNRLEKKVQIKIAANITGGGFYENIPRSLPEGLTADIRYSDVQVKPVFELIQQVGDIPLRDMYNTFNMGVGMTVIIDKSQTEAALDALPGSYVLGTVAVGDKGVFLHE